MNRISKTQISARFGSGGVGNLLAQTGNRQTEENEEVITYAHIVLDYRPQKEDPNRVRIMEGGNLNNYPFELTTCTSDITASKLL